VVLCHVDILATFYGIEIVEHKGSATASKLAIHRLRHYVLLADPRQQVHSACLSLLGAKQPHERLLLTKVDIGLDIFPMVLKNDSAPALFLDFGKEFTASSLQHANIKKVQWNNESVHTPVQQDGESNLGLGHGRWIHPGNQHHRIFAATAIKKLKPRATLSLII
jgi:hypothetical protein